MRTIFRKLQHYAQAAARFPSKIQMWSCDNKSKICVGAPANASIRKPMGLYSTLNPPKMPDHTFPSEFL